MENLKLENLESLRGICKKDDMIDSIIDLIDDSEAVSDSTIKLVTIIVICQTYGNEEVKALLMKDNVRDMVDKYLESLFETSIVDSQVEGEISYIIECSKEIITKRENNYYSMGKSLERIVEKISTFDYNALGEFIKENKNLISVIGANKNINTDTVLESIANITKQD